MKWVVHIGWFDDLNFKYVFPVQEEFDNEKDAKAYAEDQLKSGFNVKTEMVEVK